MLPQKNRIRKEREFAQFFGSAFKKNRGQSAAGNFLIVKAFRTPLTYCRFGFIVANTIDKRATVRNRIKRQLREIVRGKIKEQKAGFDVVVIVKPAIKDKNYQQIETELLKLLKYVRLFD